MTFSDPFLAICLLILFLGLLSLPLFILLSANNKKYSFRSLKLNFTAIVIGIITLYTFIGAETTAILGSYSLSIFDTVFILGIFVVLILIASQLNKKDLNYYLNLFFFFIFYFTCISIYKFFFNIFDESIKSDTFGFYGLGMAILFIPLILMLNFLITNILLILPLRNKVK